MANEHSGVKFFIITTTVLTGLFSAAATAKDEEPSLYDIAQSVLQESLRNQNQGPGASVIGSVLQGFMQSQGGKGNDNIGDIASGLASLWRMSTGDASKENSGYEPLVMQSLIGLFSSMKKHSLEADNNNVDENNNDNSVDHGGNGDAINWESIWNVVGPVAETMANNQKDENKNESASGLQSLITFLPVVMNLISGNHMSHGSGSIPHHTHPQFLPPFLENLHEYWDMFTHSEYGRVLWQNSGLAELSNSFSDENGQLDVQKVFDSLENHSIRRKWVTSSSDFVYEWSKHFVDPKNLKKYMETFQIFINSFLRSQGYPEDSLLNMNNPVKSLTSLTNAIIKKKLEVSVDSQRYVEPAVTFFQDLFQAGQLKGFAFFSSTDNVQKKISEAIDRDVIGPILRVNRGYKFAKGKPQCAKYVLCVANKYQQPIKSGLRPSVSTLASMAASWYLSNEKDNRLQFWSLYQASSDNKCEKYNVQCSEFQDIDVRATTEYYHNEL